MKLIQQLKILISLMLIFVLSEATPAVASFDALGNLSENTTYGITTKHTYLSDGSLASTTDANSQTSNYSDYRFAIPQSETHPENVSLSREVIAPGLVSKSTDAKGNEPTYLYDTVGRLTQVAPALGNVATIAYGPHNQVTTRSQFPLGTGFD